MRRFVTLVILLLFSIPFGVSISGCSKSVAPVFCNGGDSGVTTGQITTISLQPIVYGISLNYAQIGQIGLPAATDCKGSSAAAAAFTYGTTDMTLADVEPNNGRLCGGTWNRNSGGGIPDFTYCIPTNKTGTAYVSASSNGVTSNPLPIFVHPVVTSIVLGGLSSNCTTDPTTSCCPLTTVGSPTAKPYLADSCISQGDTRQLVARIFAGTGANQTNISCQAGHLQFSSQGASQGSGSSVVTIDSNGVATANQPGSVLITANIANAASSAGFFSTCPPASITLTAPGTTTNPVVVNQNNTQPLLATAVDTKGIPLTGLNLQYVSTTPTTIPAGLGGSVVPILAGAASISAICQPPACNSSAYNQIGLFGNGTPVISNSVAITSPGTNSTVLYMASTLSQYVVTRDFTQPLQTAPFRVPYVPNSMVISNDGSTIYMGSSTALMALNAANSLSISRVDITSPGTVLAVSPDNSQIVISDPIKQTITIENSTGNIISIFGGVGTRAQYSADSQILYVAAGNQILIYSTYTGWTNVSPATTAGTPVTDVAVTVPEVGAYFAGQTTTARTYCPVSTPTGTPTLQNNVFFPQADSSSAVTDRIASTNDGLHIIGATVTPVPTLNDLLVSVPKISQRAPVSTPNGPSFSVACPSTGTLTFSSTVAPTPLSQITATAITGVLPTSDSALAFVTYTGSGGVVPAYTLAATGPGTTTYVKLSGAATAPIAGVVSADNSTMFAGTSGDNLVHIISRSTLSDTSTLAPNLTNPAGVQVPVDLMVQKPRKTT